MAKKRINFSLEEWEKQNRSIECLVFRNGTKPEDAYWLERRKSNFKMILAIDGNAIVTTDSQGRYYGCSNESCHDLFIEIDVPDEIEVRWMNLYSTFIPGNWHKSKENCEAFADVPRDGYIKLTKNLTTGEKIVEFIPL